MWNGQAASASVFHKCTTVDVKLIVIIQKKQIKSLSCQFVTICK